MVAAVRMLRGAVRVAAVPAALAVIVVLGFCGWALTVPAAVALAASWRPWSHSRRQDGSRDSRSLMAHVADCHAGIVSGEADSGRLQEAHLLLRAAEGTGAVADRFC